MGLSIAEQLAQAETHLADSHAALTAARLAIQLGKGDNQVTRASVDQLTNQINFWQRERDRLSDAGVGGSGVLVTTWRC